MSHSPKDSMENQNDHTHHHHTHYVHHRSHHHNKDSNNSEEKMILEKRNKYIEQFNKIAKEFLYKMQTTLPTEDSLKVYTNLYVMVEALDSKKPVIMFMETLEPYGVQIMSMDEHFFKNNDYVNAAESLSGKIGLVKYWDSLEQSVKNNIFQYVQTLYITGMGALGKEDTLKDVLSKVKSENDVE